MHSHDSIALAASRLWSAPWYIRLGIILLCFIMPVGHALKSARRSGRFANISFTQAIGTVLFFGGFALRVWSKRVLGTSFTYEIAAPTALIQSGPYRWLLHPSYTGLVVYIAGLSLICGQPLRIIASSFAIGTLILHLTRIPEEEEMLYEVFGTAFEEYAGVRWRLWPGVY